MGLLAKSCLQQSSGWLCLCKGGRFRDLSHKSPFFAGSRPTAYLEFMSQLSVLVSPQLLLAVMIVVANMDLRSLSIVVISCTRSWPCHIECRWTTMREELFHVTAWRLVVSVSTGSANKSRSESWIYSPPQALRPSDTPPTTTTGQFN